MTAGDESVIVALRRDPRGAEPALARAGGWSLSYRGRPSQELTRVLVAVGAAFARAKSDAVTDAASAETALRGAIDSVHPTARLEGLGAEPCRDVPDWPAVLRSGTPTDEALGLLPIDPELAGLSLAHRRLIKREALSPEDVRVAQAWLQDQGVRTAPVERPGRTVIFAAREAEILTRGLALEAELTESKVRTEASRELGALLGYPQCCIDAFSARPRQDDASLFDAALSPASARTPAEVGWLVAPLALISHAPCSAKCELTMELARALRDELTRTQPAWRDAWERTARSVQVVTQSGRALSLDIAGELTPGARVSSAVEFTPLPDAGRYVRTRPAYSGATYGEGDLTPRWVVDQRPA